MKLNFKENVDLSQKILNRTSKWNCPLDKCISLRSRSICLPKKYKTKFGDIIIRISESLSLLFHYFSQYSNKTSLGISPPRETILVQYFTDSMKTAFLPFLQKAVWCRLSLNSNGFHSANNRVHSLMCIHNMGLSKYLPI